MASSFSASVDAWVAETKQRMTAVRNQAAERVIERMQTPVKQGGNMPVDTGYLRASLQAVAGNATPPLRGKPGGPASYDPGPITLVLASTPLETPITVAYGANYARYVEYGAQGRAPRRFVALAAMQWPDEVKRAAAELRARVTGG